MIGHQLRTLIVQLALEWDLCSEDPFVFCYRIGCTAFVSPSGDAARPVDTGAGSIFLP
jgi:hypothetical protein